MAMRQLSMFLCQSPIPLRPDIRHNVRMHNGKLAAVLTYAAIFGPLGAATTYFVAPHGNDYHSGLSPELAFRTIDRAAAALAPGDECVIAAGVYRETVTLRRSGDRGQPITIRAAGDGPVVIDGSEPVVGPWTQREGGVWAARIEGERAVEAVFFDGQMLVEARWPDCGWGDNWNPELKWALTGPGTELGMVRSEALAASGVDLSGGVIYLKLSKGNSCYTRPITQHHAAAAEFRYDTTGVAGRAWREDAMPERIERHGLVGNRFFVVARGALDAAGEWWHDAQRGELLVIPPSGRVLEAGAVAVKRRVAGIEGLRVKDLVIDGLTFFACNVQLDNATRVTLRNLDFQYPSTPRIFPDRDSFQALHAPIRVHGVMNVIERCRIRGAIDGGLVVEGVGNLVQNCVIHDVNLHGRHPGPAITLNALQDEFPQVNRPNIIRHNTIYNVGSVAIYPNGNGVIEVAHNHVFNAGLHCVDISSLYIPIGRNLSGSRLHHNWLHDVHGIGFRVDIRGRDIMFDHNLVWNTAAGGKLQGVRLQGLNNTVVVNNPAHPLMVVFEPDASAEDLTLWRVQNNAVYSLVDRKSLRGGYADDDTRAFRSQLQPRAGVIDHNVILIAGQEHEFFADPQRYDFRPRAGGPLDGTGVAIPGITARTGNRPPSVGALEPGQPFWTAGADWLPDGHAVPTTPEEATQLARSLRPDGHPVGAIDLRYRRQ
jgi:hypothetical protein